MLAVMLRSTMRITGTCGSSGSLLRWSTPAHREKIAFSFGRLARRPGGGS
jgi:hypothetical protein